MFYPFGDSNLINATYTQSIESDDVPRYIGDNGFYMFYLNITGSSNLSNVKEGLNTWLVPTSVYFGSSFYDDQNNSEYSNKSRIAYLPNSDDTQFHNNSNASIDLSIISIYSMNINFTDSYRLYQNLTHNTTGNLTFTEIDITDFITRIGIPIDVICAIPFESPEIGPFDNLTAPKIRHYGSEGGGGIGPWDVLGAVTSTVIGATYYILDTAGVADVICGVGSAIISAGRELYTFACIATTSFISQIGTILESFGITSVLFEIARVVMDTINTVVSIILSALNWLIEYIKELISGTVNTVLSEINIISNFDKYGADLNESFHEGLNDVETNGSVSTENQQSFNRLLMSVLIPSIAIGICIELVYFVILPFTLGMGFIISMAIGIIGSIIITEMLKSDLSDEFDFGSMLDDVSSFKDCLNPSFFTKVVSWIYRDNDNVDSCSWLTMATLLSYHSACILALLDFGISFTDTDATVGESGMSFGLSIFSYILTIASLGNPNLVYIGLSVSVCAAAVALFAIPRQSTNYARNVAILSFAVSACGVAASFYDLST